MSFRSLALTAFVLLACLALTSVACGGSDGGEDESEVQAYVTATLPDPLPTAIIVGAVTPPPPGGGTTHVVADGDTLSGIASQYGVTVEAIMAANNITDPAGLSVGQELTIPAAEGAEPTAPPVAAASPTASASTPGASGDCTYTVASGDVADSIAGDLGVTVEELAALNNTTVDDLRSLSVGDVLTVPCAAQ
jgi:LysM repeat protein